MRQKDATSRLFSPASCRPIGVTSVTSDGAPTSKRCLNGHFGNIAQRVRQFIQITDADYTVAVNASNSIRGLEPLLLRILGRHKLQIDVAEDLWAIQAVSEMQFEQILLYLVTNSHNAMRDNDTVLLRARNVTEGKSGISPNEKDSGAEYVSIEVIDLGVGIASDIVGRIFEPFISVNGKPGSVSLASMNFAVRRLGGRISVESEVGKGTTVNVLLPRCQLGKRSGADKTLNLRPF